MKNKDISKMPKSGKIPSVALEMPKVIRLENGLTLMVIENRKFPKVSLQLLMDRPPVFQQKKGIQLLTSALLGEGTKNIPKDEYLSEIEQMGAYVSLSVTSARVETLSRYFHRVFELFSQSALNPNFTQEELDKKRKQAIERIRIGENSVSAIADRVNNMLIYSEKHPYGCYADEHSLNSVTLSEIENYYKKHFSPNQSYMVVNGDISFNEILLLVQKYFGNWNTVAQEKQPIFVPKNVEKTEINFIDVPSATQSEVGVFNLQSLTMANEDYFAVLIMNYILGGGFGSYINLNLRENKGYTYGARSFVGTNKWTNAVFGVTTKVGNSVVGSTISEILKEIKRIQNQPVSAEKLAEAKAQYMGWFVLSTENKLTASRLALNIEIEHLPTDFYKNYLKKIEEVTVADIQRVANCYIKSEQLRIIVVGNKEIVAQQLSDFYFEDKKIPLYYFDKWSKKC